MHTHVHAQAHTLRMHACKPCELVELITGTRETKDQHPLLPTPHLEAGPSIAAYSEPCSSSCSLAVIWDSIIQLGHQ